MGAHSTMEITRRDAMSLIREALEEASDEEINRVLYDLWGDKRLYNFRIVSDYEDCTGLNFKETPY